MDKNETTLKIVLNDLPEEIEINNPAHPSINFLLNLLTLPFFPRNSILQKSSAFKKDFKVDGNNLILFLNLEHKFSNDSYLRAEDVVFSLGKLIKPAPVIKILSSDSVTITLHEPIESFIEKTSLNSAGVVKNKSDNWQITSGPYSLKYYSRAEIVLKKNVFYVGDQLNIPDEIIFIPKYLDGKRNFTVPSDFINGKADIVSILPLPFYRVAVFNQLAITSDIYRGPGLYTHYWEVNFGGKLEDKMVRQFIMRKLKPLLNVVDSQILQHSSDFLPPAVIGRNYSFGSNIYDGFQEIESEYFKTPIEVLVFDYLESDRYIIDKMFADIKIPFNISFLPPEDIYKRKLNQDYDLALSSVCFDMADPVKTIKGLFWDLTVRYRGNKDLVSLRDLINEFDSLSDQLSRLQKLRVINKHIIDNVLAMPFAVSSEIFLCNKKYNKNLIQDLFKLQY